jgi:hypothetical protein
MELGCRKAGSPLAQRNPTTYLAAERQHRRMGRRHRRVRCRDVLLVAGVGHDARVTRLTGPGTTWRRTGRTHKSQVRPVRNPWR